MKLEKIRNALGIQAILITTVLNILDEMFIKIFLIGIIIFQYYTCYQVDKLVEKENRQLDKKTLTRGALPLGILFGGIALFKWLMTR